ncbi:MAG: M24 family metallopeptidase [Anaerolineaceae bacterium]|nr:M24 family metallopeptidase [Anaerolineaceae bacterium]
MDNDWIDTGPELATKLERIYGLLERHHLDALLLRQASNFAWATCGAASFINRADSLGAATLVITPQRRLVVSDNIEAPRLMNEAGLGQQGWESATQPWYTGQDPLAALIQGVRAGADFAYPGALDLAGELSALRLPLTTQEGQRFRRLGRLCAQGMEQAARAVVPGMSEYEIAAALAQAVEAAGVQATVNLVAVDERIFAYRHPLPTSRRLQKYAMLILCGRQGGLVCSLTRLVHFGPLPAEVRRKAEAVARIDAEMIAATRPAGTLGDVFAAAQAAYAAAGFPDEWQLHHQGGPAGYHPRETIATPGATRPILAGQVFAWNPSITGAKSEDTILVGEQGNEILTEMPNWPVLAIQAGGQTIKRPAILERTDL